jgi:hypothetical protein
MYAFDHSLYNAKMWERNTQVVYELRAEAEETIEHRAA